MADWQPPQFGLQTPRFDARTEFTHPTGFAAFMRGIRDGVEVEWDIAAVPADGGLPASEAIVRS
jgi:hypothetical protein